METKIKFSIVVIVLLMVALIVGLICGYTITSKASEPSQQTSKKGPWNSLRLPTSLKPLHYDVHLQADLQNFTFNGSVQITFTCIEKTDILLLHRNQLDVNLEDLLLRPDGSEISLSFRKTPWYHEANQYLVIELKESLSVGEVYIFDAVFAGILNEEVAGFYRTSYEDSSGNPRWVGVTMCALTSAREIFPCFDEPNFKANFTITLDHAPEFHALANMPLDYTEVLSDSLTRSKFKESVPMSTYLVAWAITDFEMKFQMTEAGIMLRVWARPDAINTVDYALAKGADVIDYYGLYYGTEFPLEKMDFIAVPGFSYKAMENWGINVFEPSKFLFEEGVSSASDKQLITAWISHELGHQWFGNLVTLQWWEDTWLNEGFATYVKYLGTEITEPDWEIMDLFLYRDLQPVLITDSLTTSRPISIPVSTLDEIFAQFDIISYNKGASLLRMCSYFLGESTFRKGLNHYLLEFAYSNANKDDLWKSLDQAAKEDGNDIDVKAVMDTWTLQMGYPVVTVTRDYTESPSVFRAVQDRFLLDPKSNTSSPYSDVGYKWFVPFSYTTSESPDFNIPPDNWLTPDIEALTIIEKGINTSWLLINMDAKGYFRVNYDLKNWQLLSQQLLDDHMIISTATRSSLLDDAFNLARSGLLQQTAALNLTQYMTDERDYVPWATFKEITGYIGNMLNRSPAYGNFQTYMLQLITPLYEYIGWEDPGTHVQRLLQSVAITLACSNGNEDCRAESSRQFTEWMENPESNTINPDLKLSVYCSAIADGGQEEWFFAFDQYQQTNSDTEKVVLLTAMACSRQIWILHTYASYILNPDIIRVNDAEKVIAGLSNNELGSSILWDFFWANWEYFRSTYNEAVFDMPKIVTSLTSGINTPYGLKVFESLLVENPDHGIAARPFKQAIESAQANIRWMENNYDEIAEWLENRV